LLKCVAARCEQCEQYVYICVEAGQFRDLWCQMNGCCSESAIPSDTVKYRMNVKFFLKTLVNTFGSMIFQDLEFSTERKKT
jgi:sarcosine oxidase delta subunit